MKAYHYMATVQLPGRTIQSADGLVYSSASPFDGDSFLPPIRKYIAKAFSEAVGVEIPPERVTIGSLTLLATSPDA